TAAPLKWRSVTCSLPVTNGSLKYIVIVFGAAASRAPLTGSERIRNEWAEAAVGAAKAMTTSAARRTERWIRGVLISYPAIVDAMSVWVLPIIVVAAALACPALMWLGR